MPAFERTWTIAELHRQSPVRFDHPYKVRIFAAVKGTRGEGEMTVTRWSPTWPSHPSPPLASLKRRTVHIPFDYAPQQPGRSIWYPNFADPELFGFWDGPLLAQDELQVLEHPSLGALQRILVGQRLPNRTVDADHRSTPWLFEGVPRVCHIDVMPSPRAPAGLYGNRFQRADWEIVQHAVTAIDPATTTNLVAVAAPHGGRGVYTIEQIRWILEAAYTAFAAVVERSDDPVELHTGMWGCGAFGGDRLLMILAQWAAALAAGVDEVVMHCIDAPAQAAVLEAERMLHVLDGPDLDAHLFALHRLERRWGVSDGN